MRLLSTSLVAILAAIAITACSGGSSSSSASDQSASSSTASDNGGSSSTATEATTGSDQTAAGNAATADIPSYPGATTEAAGSSMGSMTGAKSAAGKVMSTSDSFDKVYAWYQKNMPAGSEKAHTTTPVQSAVFMIGEAGKDQKSVTISVAGGKTMITIASVKM
jgi:hypothetical protein